MVKQSEYIRLDDVNQFKRVLNNRVLVKTHQKVTAERTKSGIIMIAPSETDWRPAEHTNRISEVVLAPERLFYSEGVKDFDSMPWDTDMELQKGDIVWHDFLAAHNCPVAVCDGQPDEEYKLLHYSDVYLVKRGEELIPINGYVLCEEVWEQPPLMPREVNKKLGKVSLLGKPNRAYRRSKQTDEAEVKVGDTIIKRRKDVHILLEAEDHRVLDRPYFRIQRRDIYGILES